MRLKEVLAWLILELTNNLHCRSCAVSCFLHFWLVIRHTYFENWVERQSWQHKKKTQIWRVRQSLRQKNYDRHIYKRERPFDLYKNIYILFHQNGFQKFSNWNNPLKQGCQKIFRLLGGPSKHKTGLTLITASIILIFFFIKLSTKFKSSKILVYFPSSPPVTMTFSSPYMHELVW